MGKYAIKAAVEVFRVMLFLMACGVVMAFYLAIRVVEARNA